MHVCTTADLGPGFIGWAATTRDAVIFLLAPRVREDPNTRAQVVELMARHGVDCERCPGCPVGMTNHPEA